MISHWTKFEGHPNGKSKEKARITLSPRRFFALNGHAFNAIGSPSAVEFYFDENERKIGMLPCDPFKKNAFAVRKEKGKDFHVIYAGAFLTHFSLKSARTILFNEPDITSNGMLVLDLKNTINVGRGSR